MMTSNNDGLRVFPDLVWEKIFEQMGTGIWHFRSTCQEAQQLVLRLTPKLSITFTPPQLDDVLHTLMSLQSIQHLVLVLQPTQLPHRGPPWQEPDVDLSDLAELLAGKTKLRSLRVFDATKHTTWDMPWKPLAGLKTLNMENGGLMISTAADLDLLTSLESLSLTNNHHPLADSIPLADIFRNKMLTHLCLNQYQGDLSNGLSGVGVLSCLRSLSLAGDCVSNFSCMTSLSSITVLTALTCLVLKNFMELLSFDFLHPLVSLKKLKCLSSGNRLITSPTFTPNVALEYFSLEGMGSQLLEAADLACLTNLTHLNLARAFDPARRNLDLTPLHSLTALHTLDMAANSLLLSRAAVDALVSALPALKVLTVNSWAGLSFSH